MKNNSFEDEGDEYDHPQSQHHYRVFSLGENQSGRVAKGNPCQLTIYQAEPNTPPRFNQVATLCQSWPAADKPLTICVQCYNRSGFSIHCCGHGMLAAADWWMRNLHYQQLDLLMNNSVISARREDERIWLRFPRIHTDICPIPEWVETLMGNMVERMVESMVGVMVEVMPITAALAGDEEGYLILEWPDNFPLQDLPRPGIALANFTRRGLIYTARQSSSEGIDICSRYFAPQYGEEEDVATGSAMRVLADYWQEDFTFLTAYQCSKEGGLLMSQIDDDYVDIGGYCAQDH